MSTAYKPLEYCVDGLLTQGLYLLAGAPKVGKSWLALDICLSVAKGEDVLKHQTHIGTALYLGNMGRLKSVRLDELIAQHEKATAALCEIAKAVR